MATLARCASMSMLLSEGCCCYEVEIFSFFFGHLFSISLKPSTHFLILPGACTLVWLCWSICLTRFESFFKSFLFDLKSAYLLARNLLLSRKTIRPTTHAVSKSLLASIQPFAPFTVVWRCYFVSSFCRFDLFIFSFIGKLFDYVVTSKLTKNCLAIDRGCSSATKAQTCTCTTGATGSSKWAWQPISFPF
jgi:hypothetical protein